MSLIAQSMQDDTVLLSQLNDLHLFRQANCT